MSNEDLARHRPAENELRAVERVLVAFLPRPATIDRDRLMFEAGAASVAAESATSAGADSRSAPLPAAAACSWRWPAATAALAATSLALAAALWLRPQPRVRIVYQDRTPAVAVTPDATPTLEEPTDRPIAAVEPAPAATQPSIAQSSESRRPIPPAHNYLQTREVALRMGVDAIGLPRRVGDGAGSPTYLEWLSSLGDAAPTAERTVDGAPPRM